MRETIDSPGIGTLNEADIKTGKRMKEVVYKEDSTILKVVLNVN
ncbi:MAG: hypothetical protein SGI89_01785 [bacterium]|nr:hypothetical protein [bacterium]